MKMALPFDRLTSLLKYFRWLSFHAQTRASGLRSRLNRHLPGLFYDPTRHYMRGPGPKASLKQKSSGPDSKIR